MCWKTCARASRSKTGARACCARTNRALLVRVRFAATSCDRPATVLTWRDAVTWLSENAVDGKTLSRRQALQLSRELLEMGAVQQVFENAHGFKDDTTLYRFGTLPAATATLKKAS